MGFDVAEVATEGQHVAVASSAGQTWTGKALIAADGLWSAVRSLIFTPVEPRFAGKSAARSVLPLDALPPEFFKQETGIWLFPDAHVVHYPVSAGAELAIVVIVEDEHDDTEWAAPVHPAWVRRHLPACAEPLADLISEAQNWKRWALHTMPPMRGWSQRTGGPAGRCCPSRAAVSRAGRRAGPRGRRGAGRGDAQVSKRRAGRAELVRA